MMSLVVLLAAPTAAWHCGTAAAPRAANYRATPAMQIGAPATTGAEAETALLRLAAITDRGQRTSAVDRANLLSTIRQLESIAPDTNALELNGDWRLVCAVGESPYRSSPFFWAFRQATAGMTTPIGVPGAEVGAGDALASAILGVTDTIPFYDIGLVVQRIRGVCSDADGCDIEDDEDAAASDGASTPSEPLDGSFAPLPSGVGSFESEVELKISRLFGLTSMQSLMTTVADVRTLPRIPNEECFAEATPADCSGVVEVELQIRTTSAKQSSIAALLPALDDALSGFPSGDALEVVKKRSSYVKLRTTYLSETLRISRPVLEGVVSEAVFVYSRV